MPVGYPLTIEDIDESDIAPLLEGLYRIGMGCQIMDDMADFVSDQERKRHNFLVSLIYHSAQPIEKSRLEELLASRGRQQLRVDPAADFSHSVRKATKTSRGFLESGLNLLFPAAQRIFVEPTIQFLEKRIGAAQIMSAAKK